MNDNRRKGACSAGGLVLLFGLIALHLIKGFLGRIESDKGPLAETVFVQVSGDVKNPAVYGFQHSPSLNELLTRAGGVTCKIEGAFPCEDLHYHTGTHIEVRGNGGELHILENCMSAFHKITLNIPISLNDETLDGLTAIPGVGPKIAGAIVSWRAQKHGFRRLDEMLSVPGIGPSRFSRITPYVEL